MTDAEKIERIRGLLAENEEGDLSAADVVQYTYEIIDL